MSQQAQPAQENEPITVGEQFGVFALVMLLVFGSAFLFVFLSDAPYGTQCATAISYSGAIFLYTFFRTKGVNTKHDLSAPYVRQQMPRLLLIHAAYLLGVLIFQVLALDIRPSFPNWWLVRHGTKGGPPFGTLSIVIVMAVGISQIVISRRILGRAKRGYLLREAQ